MNSVQVTLVKRDLRGIAASRTWAVATVNSVRQNFGFAFFYNAFGVPLAARVLYALSGGLLPPKTAARARRLSSASMMTHALRPRGN